MPTNNFQIISPYILSKTVAVAIYPAQLIIRLISRWNGWSGYTGDGKDDNKTHALFNVTGLPAKCLVNMKETSV